MVLFLVLINLIFQDHVKLGTEGFSVAASSALPHSAGRHCPGLPESCSVPLNKGVSFGKWRVRSKIILLILSLGFDDACSIRMVGSVAAGQAGCPCHGSYEAVVRCWYPGYLGTTFLLVFSTEMYLEGITG